MSNLRSPSKNSAKRQTRSGSGRTGKPAQPGKLVKSGAAARSRPSTKLNEPSPKIASLATRRSRVKELFAQLAAVNPDPRCELSYNTPFQLLVSVILSAQTTDKMVNRCMEPLYTSSFDPETVLAMGEAAFLEKIRSIGLAPTKARNVLRLAKILMEKFHGQVPRTREDLEALPGVGRKTANVVLGEIWREPTLAVDTHVFRVSRRLGLHNEKTPEKCEQVLLSVIDPQDLPRGHHWLILHGRYTCKAQSPLCSSCVVAALCPMRSFFVGKKTTGKVLAKT